MPEPGPVVDVDGGGLQRHALRVHARSCVRSILEGRYEGSDTLADVVHDVETGVFNCALARSEQLHVTRSWSNPTFVTVYNSILRFVLSNIDSECYVGNVVLPARLCRTGVAGEALRPRDVAFLRVDEAFPERWDAIIERSHQRDQYISQSHPGATTDQFKCARCKQRICSYVEMQTRSCDEPASIFVTCHGCGNHWRIG